MNETTTTARLHETDTGSAAAQATLLTAKIAHLSQHLKTHPNDKHSRRGLLAMVNKRRKQLRYLKRTRPQMHTSVIGALGLRK